MISGRSRWDLLPPAHPAIGQQPVSRPFERPAGRRDSERLNASLHRQQLLDGYGEQQQQRVERELQQWQREQQLEDEHQLRARCAEIMSETGPSVEEVFRAYFDCRQTKRNSYSAAAFEQNLERHLMRLHRELNDGSYRIGRSTCFVVSYPKWREVWAANFRDRIVHHVIYNRLADHFYRRFIHDSYACIPGRGSLFGARRVHGFMRSATEGWQRRAWFLQADLANFFVSIDKGVLAGLVLRHVDTPWLRRLVSQVIHHDPTRNPIVNSPIWKFREVPRHKSLFYSRGRGLPIGNLSSQFFANVYMNELDQLVKRELGIRWYGRYVDDVVMIGREPQQLNAAFEVMEAFVGERLRGAFHPSKTVRNTCDKGINFCGYILKPHRVYLRRRSVRAMQQVARSNARHLDPERWAAQVNSYLGLCRHANTYRLRRQLAIETGATFAPHLTKVKAKRKSNP